MSTTNENLISNSSYTEKDFQVIYPALLDLVKKLTSKWDPSVSNESDPGVLLLKLNAIIADKCNYNIDKNVLECFPLSVTQEENARQLFEQLGYYMHWYNSAESVVTLKYLTSSLTSESLGENGEGTEEAGALEYTIPRFTMVCDDSSSIIYTLTEEKKLVNDGSLQTFVAMQGVAVPYDINGDTLITVSSLDSNRRLYFTESRIAQNGIFIRNSNTENYSSWKRKDNLLVEELKASNCFYKFGVSQDLNTCYLEFPENVEELFQDGIYITYLRTDGEDGNISAGVLNKFYTDITVTAHYTDSSAEDFESTLDTDHVSINNYFVGVGGEGTETINDAYTGYKRTVGTFKTLVTLRDYMNAVANSDYVSNALVCDRTTDPQSSYDIITKSGDVNQPLNEVALTKDYDVSGYIDDAHQNFYSDANHKYLIDPDTDKNYLDITNDSSGNPKNIFYRVIFNTVDNVTSHTYIAADAVEKSSMSAFDLKLYLLTAVGLVGDNATAYNTTFILNRDESIQAAVESELEEYDLVQHKTIPLLEDNICLIKNKYPLNCTIIPQYTITEATAKDISTNIKKALYKNFNSTKLQFGEEISYDEVYNTILEADARIKAVALDRLTYTTYAVYIDSTSHTLKEVDISQYTTYYKDTYTLSDSLSGDNLGQFITPLYVLADDDSMYAYAEGINITLASNVFKVALINYKEVNASKSTASKIIYNSSSGWVSGLPHNIKFEENISRLYSELFNWLILYTDNINHTDEDIEVDTDIASQFRLDIYAKSVLAGKTQFFIKDTEFDYCIDQKYQISQGEVGRLDATVDVLFQPTESIALEPWTYQIRENETIQILAPNLIESASYSSNIRYEHYIPLAESEESASISAGGAYQLRSGEYIAFYWMDSDSSAGYNYAIYGEGSIIQPSFALSKVPSEKRSTLICVQFGLINNLHDVTVANHTYKYVSGNSYQESKADELTAAIKKLTDLENVLSSNRSIKFMLLNTVILSKASDYCYWILNEKVDDKYYLFKVSDDPTRILKSGEYFIYTTSGGADLNILGAGTQIYKPTTLESSMFVEAIDYSDIVELGSTALVSYWYSLNGIELDISEMQYMMMGDGVLMNIQPTSGDFIDYLTLTGDGSTKEFDLKWDVKEVLLVTIDGEEKEEGVDYSIEDSTIIFTTAPDVDATIYIKMTTNSIALVSELNKNLSGCSIKYKENINDDWIVVPDVLVSGQESTIGWVGTTSLRLNTSSSTPQVLKSGQKLYYYLYEAETGLISETYDGCIDPSEEAWAGEANILTSRLLNNIGGINISTLEKDDSDEYQPISLYAFMYGDKSDNITISEGTTYIKFKDTRPEVEWDQSQVRNLTFRLPYGDYIMPVYHATDDDIIDKLFMYLDRGNYEVYSATTEYSLHDIVNNSDEGEILHYEYINSTPATGKPLSDTNYWKVVKGELLYPMSVLESDKVEKNANMYKAGNYYLRIDDLPEGEAGSFFVKLYIEIHYINTYAEGFVPVVTVNIPPIYKYSSSTALSDDVILNAKLFLKVSKLLQKLDYHNVFDYTYIVNSDDEITNPLSAESYLNANHILNACTISQLATSDVNIYITNKIGG